MTEDPMRYEEQRLSTFKNWPSNAKVEARKIAKAGFFYTGKELEVKCFWCDSVLSDWEYGDQVMAKHRSANPCCAFVRNTSNNVPIFEGVYSENCSLNENGVFSYPSCGRSYSPDGWTHYKAEEARLLTFKNWPKSTKPKDLARSGFIYTGCGDSVRCIFCLEYIGQWLENDNPDLEHRRLFPHCPFIRGLEVGNIPISEKSTASSPSTADFAGSHTFSSVSSPAISRPIYGYDEAGTRISHQNGSRNEMTSITEKRSTQLSPENYSYQNGVIRHTGPAKQNYSTYESRKRTFKEWPLSLTQKSEELADAGFYYTGLSDKVKCFSCDGGLNNWEPSDDPWTEHARWFDKCSFVRLVKGDEFICQCIQKFENKDLVGKFSECKVSNQNLLSSSQATTSKAFQTTIQSKPHQEDKSKDLISGNQQLEEKHICKICWDNEIQVVFLPCGHLLSCTLCAPSLKNCPLCRSLIEGSVKAYIS